MHIAITVVSGVIIVVAILLAADELARLRRRHLRIWPAMWTPAAQRLRLCVLLVAFGASGIANQSGNLPAVVATTSLVVAILACNVWLMVRARHARG